MNLHTTNPITVSQMGELGITSTITSDFVVQGTAVVLSRYQVLKAAERDELTLGRLFEIAYTAGSNDKTTEIRNALGISQ